MGKFQHNNIFSLGPKKSNKKNKKAKQANAADPGSLDISQGVNIEEQK
jgi:hypothetical protein